jgi:pyridoxamine 5'-phosphate oxidase
MHGDKQYIQNIRREYLKNDLLEENVSQNPFIQFGVWFKEAIDSKLTDGNAMTLSTSNGKKIDSRIVLLKSFDEKGFVFFTNYGSQKSREMEKNPEVCLLFYWGEFERQIKINGIVKKVSREESEEYFAERPRESQLGAWASRQSQNLSSRKELEDKFKAVSDEYEGSPVPTPPFWGGFIVVPDYFEFWQGRPSRLHDRICYTLENNSWKISRLYP